MNMYKKATLNLFSFLFIVAAQAQTADEIINKYLTAIGGKEKLAAIKSTKMSGKAKQGGQEFPFIAFDVAGGKKKNTFVFQGKEIVQPAFDGNNGWNTNFMTMKAEKMDAEDTENMKRESGDFPDAFLDYQKKGYKVALEGKEKIEGTECFKIKLTKKPEKVDGKEEENVVYYFFDTQNYVPLAMRSTGKKGQMKGVQVEMGFSDYQEVNGLYFPFSLTRKVNGQTALTLVMEKVEVNVPVDDKIFAFPEGAK
jgi:hypothetical protein